MTRHEPFTPNQLWTPEECERLVESFSDHTISGVRNRALVALLWRLGLSHDEVIALLPKDFDWAEGLLILRGSKGAQGRDLPLSLQAWQLVARWDGMRRKLRKERNATAPAPFFSTFESGNFGSALSRPYVRGMLRRAATNAGIEKPLHTESLRDALAAELRQRGFNLGVVARFLGDQKLLGKPRYHTLPDGDFRGTGLVENWGQTQLELRFYMRMGTLTPTGPDAQELPTEIGRQEVSARADGSYSIRPASPERSRPATGQPDLEARLGRLKENLEQQSRLIEKLLKEVKKR